MKKIVSIALVIAISCALCIPVQAKEKTEVYVDVVDSELENVILRMLNECVLGAIFAPNKETKTISSDFVYSTQELYASARWTIQKALHVLQPNRAENELPTYSAEVLQRIVPYYADELFEIEINGQTPSTYWKYTEKNGMGNTFGGSGKYDVTGNHIEVTFSFQRSNGDMIDQLTEIAEEVKTASSTTEGRLSYLNSYMINRFSYQYNLFIASNSVNDLLRDNIGVCGSYAHMVSYICLMLGIPCVELSAYSTDFHGWNYVYVDGKWKELDVTWNDTTGSPHKYFLVDSINDDVHDWLNDDDTALVRYAQQKAIEIQNTISQIMSDENTALSIQTISVAVNGKTIQWTDAVPFIDENSRTMVPLRAVAEALGLTVSWDGTKREAAFTDGVKTIYFPIDSSNARTDNSGTIQMDTAAVIVNDRTYAPVRYLAEFFDHTVDWEGTTKTVIIK